MGKTVKGKAKAAAKIAKAKRKIDRKCKGCAAVLIGGLCVAVLTGCATGENTQPAKANTMENTFKDCIIVVAAKASVPIDGTNMVVEAEGDALPTIELFTQTQSLENSGTETATQTSTQTPTTDVKPKIDARYNDPAVGAASAAAEAVK